MMMDWDQIRDAMERTILLAMPTLPECESSNEPEGDYLEVPLALMDKLMDIGMSPRDAMAAATCVLKREKVSAELEAKIEAACAARDEERSE